MNSNRVGDFPLLEVEPGREKVIRVRIDLLQPNPYQPRKDFPEDKIGELTQSIKTYGLLHPIIVRRQGRAYQIVAGERRVLACRSLGWKTIPAIVKDLSDSAVAAMALIENLQREDLNYLDEAAGYARLIQTFNLTQEVLAQRLGKSQSTIANKMRLLKLPDEVKELLIKEQLTERHARALLKLNSAEQQKMMIREIIHQGFTVSETEKKIEQLIKGEKLDKPGRRRKGVIGDMRIFLNTIRRAIKIIEGSGLHPEVEEKVEPDYIEVTVRLYKNKS
ncbi:MAG TPA: nucleoid occlusion protein [Bacillota bacterium]|jgi:ParB family chromosome partitioning protein|nr:nucleoid occlusion protein [Bacillota bacterium]HOA34645.1 nucleoid occlusion protein [Bacillota bacterium]HOJ83273.1 nucleoid occlusion protein [Bacillota bacterium]HOL16084.1 nucleoid occlusion protein [Bacillota bacterium]HPZ11354.1 nucleoid occlusion protein [Bacillota bacterium]